ncbi:uncharacterized protein LOC122243497 [Penaeus japonicus]|uniref:uncharacterized protein LOC122243497 n=1 Tax=Penaeus japonicus TaxID=27405 RepID=UPI001C714E97|nr:uncharacterized protein LOC122243497 [Penaeus japonicus]
MRVERHVYGAVIVLLVLCQGRSWGRKPGKTIYEDRTAMSSLSLVVAREILQRMEETPVLARLARDSMSIQVSALARDSLKLGLMAYMGYQGEDQCLERTACEAGELLSTFTTGAAFMFTALDYVAPFPLRRYLSVARDAAEGHSCLYYRCGARPHRELGVTETNELE